MHNPAVALATIVAVFVLGLWGADPASAARPKAPGCASQRCPVVQAPPAPHGPFGLPTGRKAIPRPPAPR